MLHITVTEHAGTELIFVLSGEIVGHSARELLARWNRDRRAREDWKCFVDVSGVNGVDQAGEAAIRYLASGGAHFRVSGPLTSCIIKLVCLEQRQSLVSGRRDFRSTVSCL